MQEYQVWGISGGNLEVWDMEVGIFDITDSDRIHPPWFEDIGCRASLSICATAVGVSANTLPVSRALIPYWRDVPSDEDLLKETPSTTAHLQLIVAGKVW